MSALMQARQAIRIGAHIARLAPLLLLLPAFAQSTETAAVDSTTPRSLLPATTLLAGALPATPVAMTAFIPIATAKPATARFSGQLKFLPSTATSRFELLRDRFGYLAEPASVLAQARQNLPPFSFELVQHNGELIPLQRGAIASDHPAWEYLLEPGAVWQEASDGDYSRAALPFALMERNANCVHNGVLSFLFNDKGAVSSVYYQISSETCAYFQFNLHGIASAHYLPAPVANAEAILVARKAELTHRMPTQPITQIATDFPGLQAAALAVPDGITASALSSVGVVINGRHYRGACPTRHGDYPFCDALILPSYSTAKSLFAALALMRLEKQYPGISNALLTDYVPECQASGNWRNVTFGHVLDMATGNYDSAAPEADESAVHIGEFLDAETHAGKIHYACNRFPHQTAPGTTMVYHSSDTYLLGAALQAWLRQHVSAGSDLYLDVLVKPLWQSLHLSPAMTVTRRTYDEFAQPFTSFGLTLLPDDVAKLLQFLGPQRGRLNGENFFAEPMFAESQQRHKNQRSLSAGSAGLRYENGFWAVDIAEFVGCRQARYTPTMSGYGGISLVLLPNDIGYYYFSDNGEFRWKQAAIALNAIRSLCK